MTVWWVPISGPAEYMGTMGIYFHLLLADALTLFHSGGQIKPNTKAGPHLIGKCSTGPVFAYIQISGVTHFANLIMNFET